MLKGIKFVQKEIGLVLWYIELEKFSSKTIPLFFPFIIVRRILKRLNSCIFRTKYFHYMNVVTFSGRKSKKGITSLI